MSTKLKEKQERLEQILADLAAEAAKGKPVVVEGKKDEAALSELGVTGLTFTVKTGGKSFLDAASEIESRNPAAVILLLDFDWRGRQGMAKLRQNLERARIKTDTRFWRDLKAMVGHDIQSVESLPAYLETLRQKTE